MYPTVGGYLDWTRDGAQAEAGAWSVDIKFASRVDTALPGVQPDATKLRQLTAADLARAGAQSGS